LKDQDVAVAVEDQAGDSVASPLTNRQASVVSPRIRAEEEGLPEVGFQGFKRRSSSKPTIRPTIEERRLKYPKPRNPPAASRTEGDFRPRTRQPANGPGKNPMMPVADRFVFSG